MKNRISFTKKTLDSLVLPPDGKRAYYYDRRVDGLQIAVTSKGAKTFYLYKKIKGKPTRVKLGTYPALTPELARKQADKVRGQIAVGKNPQDEKRRDRASNITLAEAFEAFLKARKSLKPRTVYDYRLTMRTPLTDWQTKRLADITKDMVSARHAHLGRHHGQTYANATMRCLRSIWNFAAAYYTAPQGEPLIPENPVNRLSKTRAWFKEKRRRTYIRQDELPAWLRAVRSLQREPYGTTAKTVGDYLLLLLFTGLRRGEGARLSWAHVDCTNRILIVPDTKNREDHVLPMSDVLHAMFTDRAAHREGDFVFPGANKDGYLKEPRPQMRKVAAMASVDFTLHDLRRTFITVAESLDIPAYALKRLLNHSMANDVTAGYIVTDVERLRAPMQKITDYLLSVGEVQPKAEVIPLQARVKATAFKPAHG